MLTVGTNVLLNSGSMAVKIVLVAPCKLISVALVDLCTCDWSFPLSPAVSILVRWLELTEEDLSQKCCCFQNDAHDATSPSIVPDKPC